GKTHCYWLNNSGKNFDDSKKTCSDAGGYLATIHSKAENDFVKSVAFGNASAVWIGLWRPFLAWCSTGSNFEWVTNEANPYQNWDSGEPNCSGQGGVMDSGGGWRDRAGWESYAFVCEDGPAYQ
ncbi:MAG TPA: C-type lectin domain-containing protein, partial [Polyangiaceae bacterium]|nr:C-type lectin domain-containing protein [Polyangiaceae bacterium]